MQTGQGAGGFAKCLCLSTWGEGESSACLCRQIRALYVRIYDQESSEYSNFNLRYASSQNCDTGLRYNSKYVEFIQHHGHHVLKSDSNDSKLLLSKLPRIISEMKQNMSNFLGQQMMQSSWASFYLDIKIDIIPRFVCIMYTHQFL